MLLGSRKNVLLVKDDVGRPKPTTKNLPGEDFAFGRDKRYVESAAQSESHLSDYCLLINYPFVISVTYFSLHNRQLITHAFALLFQ